MGSRRHRLPAVVAVAAGCGLAAAGEAHAACGVESARADYEDAYVQIHARRTRSGADLVACSRRTGRASVLAAESDDPDQRVSATIHGVVAGRYLWTSESLIYQESADAEVHSLLDLHTRERARVTVGGDDGPADVVAVPGALAVADGQEVVVRRTGGGRSTLDGSGGESVAYSGGTLFWRSAGVAQSRAVAARAAPRRLRRAPRAGRATRCASRGSRTLLRDAGVVVTRTRGGRHVACRTATGRLYRLTSVLDGATATGAPTGLEVLDGRRLAYRLDVRTGSGRATAIVLLDLATGRVTGSALATVVAAADATRTRIAHSDGARLILIDAAGRREVATGDIGAVVLAPPSDVDEAPPLLYFDDAGEPRALELDP